MGNSKSKADTWGGRESKNVEAPPGGVSVEPVDLETIRADNLKNKKTDDKTSKAPQTNTIVEEAVLEDLCEEASLELEVAKAGPIDKNQKSKLLRQLATNQKTAQHFEKPENFEDYVNDRLNSEVPLDPRNSAMGLGVLQPLGRTASNCSNHSRMSVMSRVGPAGGIKRTSSRISNFGEIHPLNRASSRISHISATNVTPMGRTSSKHAGWTAVRASSRLSLLAENTRRESTLGAEKPAAKRSWMEIKQQIDTADGTVQNRRSRISVMAPPPGHALPDLDTIGEKSNEKNTQETQSYKDLNSTAYSLPKNFVSDRKSAMSTKDRKKVAIVNATNEATLRMATQAAEGNLETIELTVENDSDSDDEGGFSCCGLYCQSAVHS